MLEHGLQHREYLYVAIVIDCRLPIRLQVERVYHIEIAQIGSGRLIRQIHRVLERKIPYRERLELRISRFDTALIIVIQLREAHRHLPAAGPGGRYHDKRSLRFNIIILTESFVTDNSLDIGRVSVYDVMLVVLHAEALQPFAEHVRGRLTGVMGYDHTPYQESSLPEGIYQAQDVHIVRYPYVAAGLVLLYIESADDQHHLYLVLHGIQHADLGIRMEPGQDPGSVIVVEYLPAEFQIQLSAELGYSLTDMFRLKLDILLVVKKLRALQFEPSKTDASIRLYAHLG